MLCASVRSTSSLFWSWALLQKLLLGLWEDRTLKAVKTREGAAVPSSCQHHTVHLHLGLQHLLAEELPFHSLFLNPCRIFLDVSQNDNTALRRMNLRSFLMAPLQRVTKYPLLLSRIIKATTEYHPDHSSLREAKSRIESHLEHINMKTKQEGNTWTLRSFRQDSKKKREVINIEMRETALKTVGWLREETRFVMEGSLQLAQPPDGQWVKKGSKTLKFQNMQVLLLVNMKRVSESSLESAEPGPVKDAVLVLIRDKNNGKFHLLREPLRLSNCIVSTDPDCDDTFELIEIRREAFVFRDSDRARTHHWFRQIRRYSRELGSWKKRRNALPNIMISTPHTKPWVLHGQQAGRLGLTSAMCKDHQESWWLELALLHGQQREEPGPWRLRAALEASITAQFWSPSLWTHNVFVVNIHTGVDFPQGADLWRKVLSLTC